MRKDATHECTEHQKVYVDVDLAKMERYLELQTYLLLVLVGMAIGYTLISFKP